METYKSKTKQGGEIIIHAHCSLKELQEQIPGTKAFKDRVMKEVAAFLEQIPCYKGGTANMNNEELVRALNRIVENDDDEQD